MVCYYADLNEANFSVDKNGQLWLVDFAHAGVLPESFMCYTLETVCRDPLPREYRKLVPIKRTDNLRAMCAAGWWFNVGSPYNRQLALSMVWSCC